LWLARESDGQKRDQPPRCRRAPTNADEHLALPRARSPPRTTRNSRYPLKYEKVLLRRTFWFFALFKPIFKSAINSNALFKAKLQVSD
jgi:hypothetical protein